MPDTQLNPDDEARLKKALVQSANGRVVGRGSFAQYAQPPLNPDGIEAVMVKLFPHHVGIGPNAGLLSESVARGAREHVENIVSAYLAVAQPEITSKEELEELPYGSLIQDSTGETLLRFDGPNYDWITGVDGRYRMDEQVNCLPARVIFRPKV